MMHGFGFGLGFLGPVLMLLFWVGLILLAVWIVKTVFQGSSSPTSNSGKEPTAREVLDQRYARGEITRAEYELMKEDLT
jgi:putative membrane protein